MIRVRYDELTREFTRVLEKFGFSRERAEACARLVADASRDGVPSHGLNAFQGMISNIEKGILNPKAEPELIDRIGIVERWDGNCGPGPLNANFCMGRAISLAREHGMGCATLRNNTHWLRAGNYGWQAAEAGCVGICWTNTMFLMPPWGAKERRLGNNPMVIAAPRKEGHVVLDMAMSQFSYGKTRLYKARGREFPVPGGYDREGKLTTDPTAIAESGRHLPIGYWKGSGLALMLDLVAALLSGGPGNAPGARPEG